MTANAVRRNKVSIVLITALGVGGATVFGAVVGFLFKGITNKFSDTVLSFSGGVMLVAAFNGLIMPSLEYETSSSIYVTLLGIFLGAFLIFGLGKLVPQISNLAGKRNSDKKREKVILFVLAIAIHNLPEGIAAGVAFGTGNLGDAFTVALGIALQNIPEGMVIISPMLSAGISPGKTFFYASLTGVIEIIGTFIGYYAVSLSAKILPLALAFAGGTMVYVISDEIIPETQREGKRSSVSFAFIIGFSFMLAVSVLI